MIQEKGAVTARHPDKVTPLQRARGGGVVLEPGRQVENNLARCTGLVHIASGRHGILRQATVLMA